MFTIYTPRFSRLHTDVKGHRISLVPLATTLIIVCILLSLIPSYVESLLPFHTSPLTAKAASTMVRRINIPYFKNAAVPYNQTSIFWFGSVSSGDNSIDVRMGYNNSELYVNLNIVDRYLWYDSNAKAPNLSKFDTATVYLNTTQNGNSSPDQYSYQFVAQVDWYQPRAKYQQAFRGNGSTWVASSTPFSAVSGWRGTGFNGKEDAGWSMTYHIPFSSLGKSGAPAQGTPWKLGIKVHNQDNASGTPLSLKRWPETEQDAVPASWGALNFGLPTYQPPSTKNNASYTIRNGLNNQVVTDGMVGGSLGCYNHGTNRWTNFGTQSYPGANRINIQNEWDISDFNCFSKFYISFPLNTLPTGKGIVSAQVTLNEYGGSGTKGLPNASLIEVSSVNEGWNPSTLSWNNAPLVKENISRTVVNKVTGSTVFGQPHSWDVSKALADAYAAGQPLRLVFYSSDSSYNTGKYFFASTVGDWNATGRPTLKATLGTISSAATNTQSATSTTQPTFASFAGASGKEGATNVLSVPSNVSAFALANNDGQSLGHALSLALLFVAPTSLAFMVWMLWRRKFLKKRIPASFYTASQPNVLNWQSDTLLHTCTSVEGSTSSHT